MNSYLKAVAPTPSSAQSEMNFCVRHSEKKETGLRRLAEQLSELSCTSELFYYATTISGFKLSYQNSLEQLHEENFLQLWYHFLYDLSSEEEYLSNVRTFFDRLEARTKKLSTQFLKIENTDIVWAWERSIKSS